MPEKKPYKNWTEIVLDNPIVIGEGVNIIMEWCGGDSFGFRYAMRETPEGTVPLFSVYHTEHIEKDESGKPLPEWLRHGVSRTQYNIDPDIVCTSYHDAKTNRFWVSPSAELSDEIVEELKAELASRTS